MSGFAPLGASGYPPPSAGDMVEIRLPSGALFPVHPQEVDYLTDLARRYMEDNHFCLPAGVVVSTPVGPVDIADLEMGADLWTVDESGMAAGVVAAVHRLPPQEVVVLRTRNRLLRCSPGHKVLVWTTTPSNVRRVGNRGRVPNKYLLRWVPADEVTVGDRIVIQDSAPPEGSDRCPTRWVSEGFAEFCGLFTGDGLTVAHKYVRICRHKDASYMDYHRAVAVSEFVRANGDPVHLYETDVYTQFGSVVAADELEALGLCGGSLKKRVPTWVFRLDAKRRAAYLRGYLDSDGSVSKLGRMQFGSPNRLLIQDIWHLCVSLNVPVTNLSHSRGYSWGFVASDAARNAEVVGSRDVRYNRRWEGARPGRSGGYPDRYGRSLTPPPGCGFARVTGITREDPEPMFDLTVEGTHSFIANGVVTHNSNVADLQDVDRMLLMELMCFRWGVWLSRGTDYQGNFVDLDAIEKSLKNHSAEVRQIKAALDITKRARDRAKGEDSVPAFIANLLARGKEFGVHREKQSAKAIELFMELNSMVTLYLNCDETERVEMHVEAEDVLEWIVTTAIPEFQEIDLYFRAHQQRFWVRTL